MKFNMKTVRSKSLKKMEMKRSWKPGDRKICLATIPVAPSLTDTAAGPVPVQNRNVRKRPVHKDWKRKEPVHYGARPIELSPSQLHAVSVETRRQLEVCLR